MIIGVGFDLVDIIRIERLIKDERFLKRVYCEEERAYIASRGLSGAQSAAGMFAAKEAFLKSLGMGIFDAALSSVAVSHGSGGEPYLKLTGEAKEAAESRRAGFLLTITHTDKVAGAVVIAQTDEK